MKNQPVNSSFKQALVTSFVLLATLTIFACAGLYGRQSASTNEDWPNYGRDYTNQRLSPLTQINQQNVKNLQLA